LESGSTTVDQAAEDALEYMFRKTGGRGGIIVVGLDGQVGHSFTSQRMAWASIENAGGAVLRSGIDA
jgi:L-asparaginase / beta-aspartyl-peptidase